MLRQCIIVELNKTYATLVMWIATSVEYSVPTSGARANGEVNDDLQHPSSVVSTISASWLV